MVWPGKEWQEDTLIERGEKGERERGRKDECVRGELDRLTWQSYLELSLAGLSWTGLYLAWVELNLLLVWCSNDPAGIQSFIHTCTCRTEQRKVGLEWHIIQCGCDGFKAGWSGVTVVCCDLPFIDTPYV